MRRMTLLLPIALVMWTAVVLAEVPAPNEAAPAALPPDVLLGEDGLSLVPSILPQAQPPAAPPVTCFGEACFAMMGEQPWMAALMASEAPATSAAPRPPARLVDVGAGEPCKGSVQRPADSPAASAGPTWVARSRRPTPVPLALRLAATAASPGAADGAAPQGE